MGTRSHTSGFVMALVCACDDPRPPASPQTEPLPVPPPAELRAIVYRPRLDALPRASRPEVEEIRLLEELAAALKRPLRLVPVERRAELLEALRRGEGDLIGTLLRPAPDLGISFSAPVRFESLVVAAAAGVDPPAKAADLRGQRVCALEFSEATPLLARLGRAPGKAPEVRWLDGGDTTDLLLALGPECPFALLRADQLAAHRLLDPGVHTGHTIEKSVPLAWAVASDGAGRELLDALNGHVFQGDLTWHRKTRYQADLPEIAARRVLRIAMLNNSVAYFIYRGQELGFQYELASLLAARIHVRLEVVVPDRPDELERLVAEGRADLALVTPSDSARGVTYSAPVVFANQVLVQPAGEPPIADVTALAQRTVVVRAASQYQRTLDGLRSLPGFKIVPAAPDLETEDLIDQVGRGHIPLTVANSFLLEAEQSRRDDVQGSLVLARDIPLVFVAASGAIALRERVERFVEQDCRGPRFDALYNRYFAQARLAEARDRSLFATGAISEWDDLAREAGRRYGIDWRLILAQMYQESRFDPKALSWCGARGLLQVMPATGRELGVQDLWDPVANVDAGVRYLAQLLGRFEASVPTRQRVRFALAAYNAGIGHVEDARRLARKRGLDPDRWFGHVEKAMALLEMPAFYRQARNGYCRCREPVNYVSTIQTKYDAYAALKPAAQTQ